MKRIIPIALAILLAASLFAGCSSNTDVEIVGEVNVYNWGEYIDETLLDKFTEETGIKVNYQTFDSNESMYAKVKSGGANFDVVIPSDYMISRMIEEDMLEKLDFGNIPNFSDIREDMVNPAYDPTNEYSVPYTWGIVGIIYNTTMVDDVVDSWDILWDEKYAGQILMFDNSRDAFGIALLRLGYSLNTTDENELQEAADLLAGQKSVIQAYCMDQILQKMPAGEAAIAPYYVGDFLTMYEENPDLAFAVPKEGTNRFADAMCILKGAANKQNAEKFIDFMTREDNALANIEFICYSTPSDAVYEQLDEETKNGPSYPSDELLQKCEEFTNLPTDTLELYEKLWFEVRM